ncbi:hypothetical protein PFISCL1PPCAC_14317, partial [Pristionchus fissidentatus]
QSIPLNFILAIVVVRERSKNKSKDNFFRSSFFDILIMDPPALTAMLIFTFLKVETPISEFLFESNWDHTAAWCYYCIYFVLYWKVTGIALVTLQRTCTCCYPSSKLSQHLDSHPKAISGLCMLFSPILTGILWVTSPQITFNNVDDLAWILDKKCVARNLGLAAGIITSCIVVSAAAYGR